MIVLALDSTALCATAAACVFENGALSAYAVTTVKNALTHSETLLPIADGVLGLIGYKMKDVGLFAVSVGPGSFTGVRIGVSLVKGLAFAYDLPCAAVSPLEALACSHSDFDGIVCAVMDARRNQFYNALFKHGKRITPDRAISLEELAGELGGGPALICGDGTELFCKGAGSRSFIPAPAATREQNALAVALCGYGIYSEGGAVSPSALSPVYLRKPQAEREREERLGAGN